MNLTLDEQILILKSLEATVPENQKKDLNNLLSQNPEARAFLREAVEQGILIADLERMKLGPQTHSISPLPPCYENSVHRQKQKSFPTIPILSSLAALIALTLAILVYGKLSPTEPIATLTSVHGSVRVLRYDGTVQANPEIGSTIHPGDTIETLSSDASVKFSFPHNSSLYLGEASQLRAMKAPKGGILFHLPFGTLSGFLDHPPQFPPFIIQTPESELEFHQARFEVRSRNSEGFVKIHEGLVQVRRLGESQPIELHPQQQVRVTLDPSSPLHAESQPEPVSHWACSMVNDPEAVMGRWLPPAPNRPSRLSSIPFLYRPEQGSPVVLFIVYLAIGSMESPAILLQTDSTILVRGSSKTTRYIRYGITAKSFQGGDCQKFEYDPPLRAYRLFESGDWEIELPLNQFLSVPKQSAPYSPGLEMTGFYAFSGQTNINLEVHSIELLSQKISQPNFLFSPANNHSLE